MELILLILKIILIAFLSILGIMFFLLGAVLLVPIKYEISGSVGDAWEVSVKGKVSYLLSAIKFSFFFENKQFSWKLFLLGFEKKMKSDDTAEVKTSEEEDTGQELTGTKPAEPEVIKQDVAKQPEEKEVETVTSEVLESSGDGSDMPKLEEKSEAPEEDSHIAKLRKVPKGQFKKKKEKTKSNIDFAFIKQQITDEHNQSVVRKIWSELVYLFRHFKFRKIVTDLVFATGDPAVTGQTLGILSMMPVLYRYNFKIIPDFEAEEAYVKGTFLVAGKVRLIHILITILRLIFDKEVRIVVKRLLKQLEK